MLYRICMGTAISSNMLKFSTATNIKIFDVGSSAEPMFLQLSNVTKITCRQIQSCESLDNSNEFISGIQDTICISI